MSHQWDEGDRAAATFVAVIVAVGIIMFVGAVSFIWWMIR